MDLKDKAAEKRYRSQPRDRGKVAGKREEISKKRKGQGGGPKERSKQNDKIGRASCRERVSSPV